MKKQLFFSLLFVMCVLCNPLSAGWVITLRHNSPEGLILYETLMMEGRMVKSTSLEGTFIYDLQSGLLTLVFEKELAYWQGDIFVFRAQMDSAMQNFVDVFVKALPENSREMYAPILAGMSGMFSSVAKESLDTLKVEIEKTNEQLEIAGYLSEKYLVKIGEKIMDQVWIAPSLLNSGDFDGKKLAHFSNQVTPFFEGEIPFDRTEAFLSLWNKGFVMKSKKIQGNAVEVIKVTEQPINQHEFFVPLEYQTITVDEIIRNQLLMGENDFDTHDSDNKN